MNIKKNIMEVSNQIQKHRIGKSQSNMFEIDGCNI